MSQKDAQVEKAKQLHDAIEKMTEDRRFRPDDPAPAVVLESKRGTNDIIDIIDIHSPHHFYQIQE